MNECPFCNAKYDDSESHCPKCGARADSLPPEESSGLDQLIAEYDSMPKGLFQKLKRFFSAT
jgi:predicted amidophosphoribosyltransferase